jgi:hypothetical protein
MVSFHQITGHAGPMLAMTSTLQDIREGAMNGWPALVPKGLGRLRILRLRFELEAQAKARLPGYLGSTLRGGLAMALRRMVCTFDMRACDGCPVQNSCHYPAFFETPTATGKQEIKRMRDIPHPLVIEPPLKHPGAYTPGDRFCFEVVLVGKAVSAVPYLVFAVNEMAGTGLGVNRAPFRLLAVSDRNGQPVYDAESGRLLGSGQVVTVEKLVAAAPAGSSVRLVFETPLRLKSGGSLMARQLDVNEFLKHVSRRLWALTTRYEDVAPSEVDFRPLLDNGATPHVAASSLEWKDLSRYSNRQKSKLKMGGMMGEVTFCGDMEAWWPLFVAISEVHAGKGAIMGLGRIRVEPSPNTVHLTLAGPSLGGRASWRAAPGSDKSARREPRPPLK